MIYKHKNRGTCSQSTTVELEDGVIKSVRFEGGCNGNTKGIARLCEGQRPQDVIERLKGVRCGLKSTSCPDQLAQALEEALRAQQQ
ncbi:MAG: TIGR03905 family TSCPD domain-containing protein [Oscillospiraceae bacterium]|nr:TIGR03905 family TSCPD domain-containing protein [Oscillospiraceae bacterium]